MSIDHLSNQHILEQIGTRFLAARLNKNITQQELAKLSGVNEKTISNLEKGAKSVGILNMIAILRALDLLDQLNSFMPEPPPRAAALLKTEKKRRTVRQRASNKANKPLATDARPWVWGEDQSSE